MASVLEVMARPAPLPTLERDVLVGRGVGKQRDPAEPRLAHAQADAVDEGKLPDRRKDRPLDHQLLDPEEDLLAPRAIELFGLLPVERVDVGVAAVGEHATLDQMSLDARRGIAEGAGAGLDDVLVFLFAVFLDEGRALDRSQLAADADREQVVDHGFADIGVRGIAVIGAGIEALGEPRGGEQLPGLGRVVDQRRRLPVEIVAPK
jgi:hypothetical protein